MAKGVLKNSVKEYNPAKVSGKTYGLIWEEENTPEKVVRDCEEYTPLLKEITDRKIIIDPGEALHLLIEGDNYHSLSVLLGTHRNKIDLIYIDPPYNTGKQDDFMYNDKYMDLSDTYRHSKWLSFISKRLLLAKELLKDSGAIFISIDDNEIAQLKLLCNQIFGDENFVAQFIRKNKAGSGHDSGQIAVEFDYMLCFAKSRNDLQFEKETLDVAHDRKYRLIDEYVDYRGKYYLRDLDYKGSYSETMDYPLTMPDGSQIYAGGKPGKHNTWRWSSDKLAWGKENGFIVFKKNKDKWKAYIKQYQFADNNNRLRVRKLPFRALIKFLNSEGSQELNSIVEQNIFKFPKPTGLILFCMNLFASKEITVLDFFAGSGTTGHAVLKMNHRDGGKRQFILCTNNENGICETVTYPRIKKVMEGYMSRNGKKLHPLGGNLKYLKTGFAETEQSRMKVSEKSSEKKLQPDLHV